MDSDTAQPVRRRPYGSFIALIHSLLGWALFDAWLFLIVAGFLMHVFVAMAGATLTIRSALCLRIERNSTVEQKKSPATISCWAGASCVLLYVLGAFLGTMVLQGSLMLLGAVLAPLTFAPWARLRFSRDHLAISCVVVISGFASVIGFGHRSIDTMFLPLAAWAFWSWACCSLLLRTNRERRLKGERNVTTETVKPQPRPTHSVGY
jgi:hypothetical protein